MRVCVICNEELEYVEGGKEDDSRRYCPDCGGYAFREVPFEDWQPPCKSCKDLRTQLVAAQERLKVAEGEDDGT